MTNHLHLEVRNQGSKIALIHQVDCAKEAEVKTTKLSLEFDTSRNGKVFLTYFTKANTSKFIQVVGHNTVHSILDNRLHSSSDIQGQNMKRVFQAIDTDISGQQHFT